MTYCTIVELDWSDPSQRAALESMMGDAAASHPTPHGCVSRILSIDGLGARVIEVWESGDAARPHAERSTPATAATEMQRPSRVTGFEVSEYFVA